LKAALVNTDLHGFIKTINTDQTNVRNHKFTRRN
jgi:hypothetical protein